MQDLKVIPFRPKTPRKAPSRRFSAYGALFALILILALAALAAGQVFSIRHIVVDGNGSLDANEVVHLSGISYGENLLRINEEEVKARLSGHGNFEYISLARKLPDAVTITISERIPFMQIEHYGRMLVLDKNGVVIKADVDTLSEDLPLVIGAQCSDVREGRRLVTHPAGQIDTALLVVEALVENAQQEQVSELNVSDLDKLYLVSRAGIQVYIRNDRMLNEKLSLMERMLRQLEAEGKTRGIIDVSTGKNVFYTQPGSG